MRNILSIPAVLGFILIITISPCFSAEPSPSREAQASKYLHAVREFADNVLKYGRDTYGPKHTPLFVDGLNIHTHEPVKWIAPNGDKWVLSNLASQQNLFRTLDGLTTITGDPKYRQAAMEAIEYAFGNLRSPNGLLYWGGVTAYDAFRDAPCGRDDIHVFKAFYPYYELMWQVDPAATRQLVESFWASHIVDWSNLEMNRIGPLDRLTVPKGWEHEYKGGPVFFKSWRRPVATTGSDLYYAAAVLHKVSGQKEPLVWGKRLASRYVETRDPKTGISTFVYTLYENALKHPLAEDFKGQVIEIFLLFPPGIEQMLDPTVFECKEGYFMVSPEIPYSYVSNTWICCLLVGELSGSEGREFTQWALEELTARGKFAYRKKDSAWIPLLPDGTSLEGYVYKRAGFYGPKGTAFRAISAVPMDFWGYALAYRVTGDAFMLEMTRDIAQGLGLGDVGITPADEPKLQIPADHFDPYTLLALLELYKETEKIEFLQAAQKVGDNILAARFHEGFFAPSNKHIYAKFDAIEALVLLHLNVAKQDKGLPVPQVLPGRPLFNMPFRNKTTVSDNALIYTLTESPYPPTSLQEAAACGDVELVKKMIEQGVDVNSKEGLSLDIALHRAVVEGHEDAVRVLLANGAYVNAKDEDGGSAPLHHAAERGHKRIAEILVASGADINTKKLYSPPGDTPLHCALKAGHKETVKLIIKKGADINAKNGGGQTPLDIALSLNREDIVELLIEKGATFSTIHEAAKFGSLEKVREFIEGGADVNAKDEDGYTPLSIAVSGGRTDVADFLIAKGADVNAKDKEGYTPLYSAIWKDDKDMVKLFVDKGADVNVLPKNDGTPLEYAVWNNDKDMAELFIAHGARFDAKDNDGWTAFRYAVSQGNGELVEFFVSKGADVSTFHKAACVADLDRVRRFYDEEADIDAKDELNWTPLHWAASMDQVEVAEFLIAKGADVNAKKQDERTPLHQAAVAGAMKLSKLLISRGADVKAKDKYATTPLHRAAASGHPEVAKLLVANGADVDPKNRASQTPLFSAAQGGHKDVVKVLVAEGADIDARIRSDFTALHFMVLMDRKDMAALLIDSGADVNAKNTDGQTPLHLAVRQGHRDTAEILISGGADVNAKNKWDRTPLDIAVDQDHTEIVELLRKQGVRQ